MAVNALRQLPRRPVAWCVVVYGLPYRFCSHRLAPSFSAIPDGRLYDDASVAYEPPAVYETVLEVGEIAQSVDDVKGVALQAPVEVRMLAWSRPVDDGTTIDPIAYLGRVTGHPSARRRVNLRTSLDHAPVGDYGGDVEVTRDVSGWDIPGPIYIGQEVMWATGTAGTGTDVDPFRFTGVTRAADHNVSQAHAVNPSTFEVPKVTSDVVNWRGRRAVILAAPLDPLGQPIRWARYWEGFIDSPPECDGVTVTLRISPLSAVMAYVLGVGSASRTATAVPGKHRVTAVPISGSMVDARISWDVTLRNLRVLSVSGSDVTLADESAARLDAVGADVACGMNYTYQSGAGYYYENAVSYASPVLTFADAVLWDPDDLLIATGTIVQTHPLYLADPDGAADEIVDWPDRLLDVVSNNTAWQTASPIASWADPSDSGAKDQRIGRLGIQQTANGYLFTAWADLGGPGDARGSIAGYATGGRVSWAGLLLGHDAAWVRAQWRGRTTMQEGWITLPDTTTETTSNSDVPHTFPLDIPVWFYQPGEKWIGPFDVDVYTGGRQRCRVSVAGSQVGETVYIVGSETVDGLVYYEVDQPELAPAVLQLQGDESVTLQVIAGGVHVDPMRYVLELLASGVGNGDNGAYDVMPIGANVPTGLVDSGSFNIPGPAPLMGQTYEAARGKSITDMTEPLLLACGVVVAAAYSETRNNTTGAWRLALVPMHPAAAADSVCDITDADIIDTGDGRPVKTTIDGRTIRGFEVVLNYTLGQEAPPPIALPASVARDDAQTDSGEPVKMDLPGVLVPGVGTQIQAAALIVADPRARTSVPRLRWELSVPADLPGIAGLALCDVVTLTSAYAIGIDPTAPVVGAPCRVVGLKRSLETNRAELELRPFPGVAAGWAPSAIVDQVISATEVRVAKTQVSENDPSFFAAGDVVTASAPGDWASRVTLTVNTVNVSTRHITFTSAHAFSVGDEIRWADYSAVATSQKVYAFIADGDDELPGPVAGYVVG